MTDKLQFDKNLFANDDVHYNFIRFITSYHCLEVLVYEAGNFLGFETYYENPQLLSLPSDYELVEGAVYYALDNERIIPILKLQEFACSWEYFLLQSGLKDPVKYYHLSNLGTWVTIRQLPENRDYWPWWAKLAEQNLFKTLEELENAVVERGYTKTHDTLANYREPMTDTEKQYLLSRIDRLERL